MLNYKTHIEKESMYNTPPVLPVFAAAKTLEWLVQKGGVKAMQKINEEKAALLYGEIERNKLFAATVPDHEDRSLMNVCFVMADNYKELENEFSSFAKSKGMVGIPGHRSVGGFRASLYNALPLESVRALVECMKEFENKY
jgi:phosphoserine aminotransferase